MKKITIICTLLFAILSGVYSQQQQQNFISVPDPKRLNNFEYRLFPKPLSVKKTHSRVIVIFDRKEWDAFHYMHRKMWLRRDELRKQMDEIKNGKPKWSMPEFHDK